MRSLPPAPFSVLALAALVVLLTSVAAAVKTYPDERAQQQSAMARMEEARRLVAEGHACAATPHRPLHGELPQVGWQAFR
jgi:hypothetical protein